METIIAPTEHSIQMSRVIIDINFPFVKLLGKSNIPLTIMWLYWMLAQQYSHTLAQAILLK